MTISPLITTKQSRCPWCGGHVTDIYTHIPDRLRLVPDQFSLSQCLDCQLVFTNPIPQGNLDVLYPAAYLTDSGHPSSTLDRWYRHNQYAFDFHLFHQATGLSLNQITSYLDLGCGTGDRLDYASSNGCPLVWGLDKYSFAFGHQHIFTGEIGAFHPAHKFMLVSLFHVLEHLGNPQETFHYIRTHLLDSQGYLLIQVPNFAAYERTWFHSRWFCLDVPRHIWHFTRHTLTFWLEKSGFTVIAAYASNAPLHPVSFTPSLIKDADPQRISLMKPGIYQALMMGLWIIGTLVTIPLNVAANVFHANSMLTLIAKPHRLNGGNTK